MSLILAVDDSPVLLSLLVNCLQNGGHDIVAATNGDEALTQLRRRRFDMVVTDLNMPVMTGLDFLAAAREVPQGQGVPILLLTSEEAPGLRGRAHALGATGWLPKPLDGARLLEVVRNVV